MASTAIGSNAVLPNACTLLTKAQPEVAFGHGKTLVVSHRKSQKSGTGATATVSCSELVGKQPVALSLSGAASGGFGGINVTSQSHPTGLGAGDTLTVGTSPSGSPVDFISFHRRSVYTVIYANGASPSLLTAFARKVYKLL